MNWNGWKFGLIAASYLVWAGAFYFIGHQPLWLALYLALIVPLSIVGGLFFMVLLGVVITYAALRFAKWWQNGDEPWR